VGGRRKTKEEEKTMQRQAALVILALVCVAGLAASGQASGQVSVSDAEIVREVNSRRLSEGLATLEMDAILSDVLRRKIDRAAASETEAFTMDADWTRDLVSCIPDWDVSYFLGSGETESDVLQGLMAQPEFVQAVVRPEATHLAMACHTRSSGGRQCVVCIIRRLVDLGPFEVEVAEDGPTQLTIQGTSSFPLLRVSFCKGTAEPTVYEGEQHTTHATTDESGRFRVTLPISMFGEGDYRIAVYVAERSDAEYAIAASTRFRVGE